MDKKSAKTTDSNLRNVPKHDTCSKSVCFKTVKCSKTRPVPKVCICYKSVKCSKIK